MMVIMMTGISANSGSCRSAAKTDQPSRSGIITSRVIAIGRTSFASFNPSHPPRRGHPRKAIRLEVVGNEFARGGVVVDDEDAIARRRPAAVGRACSGVGSGRQAHAEDRALARRTLHRHVA